MSLTVTDSLGLADATPATVTVTVMPASNGIVYDNADTSFSTVGSWGISTFSPDYYGADYALSAAGTGENTATWTINITQAGFYHIDAWWTEHSNRASNAPYSIYNNGILIGTVRVDQRTNGGVFNRLISYGLDAGTLTVELSNDADGYVVADALQLEFVTSSPIVEIQSPVNGYLSTASGVTVRAAASGSTSGVWGVEFVLNGDDANSTKEYNYPYEHTYTNLALGEYTVVAYLIDGAGARQSVNDQVNFGVGDYYVGFGDSITAGYGDDITSDNISLDGRNDWKGYEPILNNLLTAKKGYPHTVEAEGFGGSESLDGAHIINDVISRHPGAQYFLIMFGTNDSHVGTPSGLGLNPGDANYAGTYKENIQTIIDSVVAAGMTPVLAKVPYRLNSSAAILALVQEYNQVIDELIAANGILVPAPDFYTYFASHTGEFSDDLHPNGVGYQSMANLWANIL